MSRVNTRIRSDVMEGDLVYRNNRGWWVPAQDIPNGAILRVYQNGALRSPTSEEFTSLGFAVAPVTKEAAVDMKTRGEEVGEDSLMPVFLAILLAAGFVISIALLLSPR